MLTGKALFNSLVAELNDMGLPGMSSTLDEMYRSADFVKLDPLMAIAMLVEPEYQKKMTKRIQSRAVCAAQIFVVVPRSFLIASIRLSANICPTALPKSYPPLISLNPD